MSRDGLSRAPPGFADAIDGWIAYLSLERGLSARTCAAYQSDLDLCARFLAGSGAVANWEAVPTEALRGWLAALAAAGVAATSVARKLAALRGFFQYRRQENNARSDPTATLVGPGARRRLPGTLSLADVEKLLSSASGRDPLGLRNRALLELLYSSGLRVSEIAGLTLQQLDLEEALVRVYGKGSKERTVPVGGQAVVALRRYLDAGRPGLVRAGRTRSHVFLSERGGPLSRAMLWVIVRRQARLAGIRTPVKPHLLRHAFATHLLAGGADLRAIQEMLGHANLGTTEIYTAVEPGRLARTHERHHPRNRDASGTSATGPGQPA